ncbi:MAG: 3-phosphoshikimate 1-carboxyvinyltransferase [Halobacteriota archaeon]|nr:3-phosphoshikimate 1-carboxyvinyltransferase [Halobacteriota archaeon]
MKLLVDRTEELSGKIGIPASKSHTVRAVVIASLADGTSKLIDPLISEDTMAAVNAATNLGAGIEIKGDEWIIEGFAGSPKQPKGPINFENSGTSSRLMMSVIALGDLDVTIDGDDSLRKRPMSPLIDSLVDLGASVKSLNGDGCMPINISGRIKGGKTEIECKSSQYLSSLLISCPLAEGDTDIRVKDLHERPYVEITLEWLDKEGIKYENDDFRHFRVQGNQKYVSFERKIPGDWSSATFPLCAAAMMGSDVVLNGVDMNDSQGDREVVEMLKKMGADITVLDGGLQVRGSELKGREFDMGNTPDALPAMAVVGCFADGTTHLLNVSQARIKETDRITIMTEELKKMGADIEELEDGLIVKNSKLYGAKVRGHNDHRIVMALSLAGLISEGQTEIDTAESTDVTFPGYVEVMQNIKANMRLV